MLKKGEFIEAVDRFYASDIEQTEPNCDPGSAPKKLKGLQAIRQHNVEFCNRFEIKKITLGEPLIGKTQFGFYQALETMDKTSNQPMPMDEFSLYTVNEDGKVCRAEFFLH